MMKIYYSIAGFVIILIIMFGFVLPFLISYNKTIFVVSGFILLINMFPIIYFWGKSIIKQIKAIQKENNDFKEIQKEFKDF